MRVRPSGECPAARRFRVAAAALSGVMLVLGSAGTASAHGVVSIPIGQDITHGGVSHPRTLQTTGNNPASPVASERRGVWFGLGSVSLGYEVGNVDNLVERAERFEEELDRDDLSLEEAEALKEEFDQFLAEVGRDGYVKAGGSVQLPFTPIGASVGMLGGAVSFEARGVGGLSGRVLDAPIEIQPVGGGDFELQSRTSAYVKGVSGYQLSLGYSAGVLSRTEGSLFVGGRLSYYNLELAKGVIALEDTDDGEDFSDGLEDDLDRNRRTSTGVGLDLGALWVARHYQVGGTLRNLNEPEFDYPSVGRNCNDPGLSEVARRNCFTAASFGDRISLNETFTMERQLQLEGAVFTANRNWSLGLAYDVNSTRDAVGDEHQWASISGGYAGSGWLIPGFRLGYRTNLAGTELSYYTGGLTFFRVLNVDAAISTETVDVDGDTVPRSAMGSVSLELYF